MADHRDELSPSYSWYLRDWRASDRVRDLSWKERGFYRECLDWSWDLNGLPNDPVVIQKRLRATAADFKRLWPAARQFYVVAEDGRLRNPRQEVERHKQTNFRLWGSEGGKAHRRRRSTDPDQPQTEASLGSQASKPALVASLEAEPSSFLVRTLSRVPVPSPSPPLPHPVRAMDDEEMLGLRGGQLVERYGVLYAEHRHGARHRSRPTHDWHDAMDLCRTWDDARLEKLAVIVLTTDDPWISRTDRSFKIFALKATWADNVLKLWEIEHQVTA